MKASVRAPFLSKRCYHRVKSGDARVYRKFNLPPYGLADSTRGLTMLTTAGKIVDYFIPREARDEASIYMMFRNFRSEEQTSELKSLMRISYAVFCLIKKHIHTSFRIQF